MSHLAIKTLQTVQNSLLCVCALLPVLAGGGGGGGLGRDIARLGFYRSPDIFILLGIKGLCVCVCTSCACVRVFLLLSPPPPPGKQALLCEIWRKKPKSACFYLVLTITSRKLTLGKKTGSLFVDDNFSALHTKDRCKKGLAKLMSGGFSPSNE